MTLPDEVLQALAFRQALKVTEMKRMAGSCFAVCPRCKITLEWEYQSFCDRCGQCLDWRDYGKRATCKKGK